MHDTIINFNRFQLKIVHAPNNKKSMQRSIVIYSGLRMQSKVGASNFINYPNHIDKPLNGSTKHLSGPSKLPSGLTKPVNKEFKFMVRQTNEVDNLIKKKKEILESAAKEAVVDFDVIFYQFKIIEQNMFCG